MRKIRQRKQCKQFFEKKVEVHSRKRISHTTNIKLEPYSIVTDTSTIPTDYASVASNESFYDASHILNGQPISGLWPGPILPMKSHSESNNIHKLTQRVQHDVKKSSSDTTMNIDYGKRLEELNITTINIPEAEKYDISKQKDAAEPIQVITPMLSSNEQNKLHFDHFQQQLASFASPLVSMLGTRIETTDGESSTDQNLEINETDKNIMTPIVALQSKSQSIKSNEIHNEIDNKLVSHSTSSYFQQNHFIDSLPTSSISSMQQGSSNNISNNNNNNNNSSINNNNNNSNDANLIKNKYANQLVIGIGKILREKNGGIAALYKNALEMPNSRFSKILYSMIA
uniref:Uncharacterized protein n=1 Tax=Wuchereria bancrofti TaxID=6293 RepID=A0A1I8EX30_WUCBA